MKNLGFFAIILGLGISATGVADPDFTTRRLEGMYKDFAGTYVEQKLPSDGLSSGGETFVSVFVRDGALTAYTLTPFSTMPHKTMLSLRPFHRDYQVFLDDAELGRNAVGSLDSHRITNGIERLEIRTGRFRRQVLSTRITLDHGVLSLTDNRRIDKRLAFFGPWVTETVTYGGYMQAVKIAARPIPELELSRMASLHADGYSATTGQGVYSDNEIEEPPPPNRGRRVIPVDFRKRCAKIVDPHTQE